jgi:hypothetical protein
MIEIDVCSAEKLLEMMGYNWKNHYEDYTDFVQNLSETMFFNFKID